MKLATKGRHILAAMAVAGPARRPASQPIYG